MDGEGRLAKRVALVTGGCGDIGRAIAMACAREGATVVVSDVFSEQDAQARLGGVARNTSIAYLPCDVRDRAGVIALLATIEGRYGSLDVAVANAGITHSTPALEVSPHEWQHILDVNLTGAFHVAQEAAAVMARQAQPGALVFTGSWVGEVPSKGLLPYCVSKAGIQMLARCLALELAPLHIRANVVAPGVLDAGVSAQIFRAFPERRTPFEKMIPLGTLGTAEQVAESVVFLASDASDYITGTTLLVDGGASLFQFQS